VVPIIQYNKLYEMVIRYLQTKIKKTENKRAHKTLISIMIIYMRITDSNNYLVGQIVRNRDSNYCFKKKFKRLLVDSSGRDDEMRNISCKFIYAYIFVHRAATK